MVVAVTIAAPVVIGLWSVHLAVVNRIRAQVTDIVALGRGGAAVEESGGRADDLSAGGIEVDKALARSAEAPALHVVGGIVSRTLNVSVSGVSRITIRLPKVSALYFKQRLLAIFAIYREKFAEVFQQTIAVTGNHLVAVFGGHRPITAVQVHLGEKSHGRILSDSASISLCPFFRQAGDGVFQITDNQGVNLIRSALRHRGQFF